jgi:gluconokinase
MFLILMGVSGSGKTTIGELLSAQLGWPFYDADHFHPPQNVAKMRAGIPLTEADRVPWLAALADLIRRTLADPTSRGGILACSALSKKARATLRVDPHRVVFIHLRGSKDLIRSRLEARKGHYMPPTLLDSQFAALEDPSGEAITIDIGGSPDSIAAEIRRQLGV